MIPDSNSAVPLYRQIARDLINRIDQGEFYTGQCIPSEARLCVEYGVSRPTSRNAVAELVEQEILVSHKGKGVFVRTPKISSNLSSFRGFTYFCNENNIEQYTHVLETDRQIPAGSIRGKLELKEGETIVYLKRLRRVNQKPVMIEHVYIPYKEFGFLLELNMENRSLYEEIERRTGLKVEDNCYTAITLETSLLTEEEKQYFELHGPQAAFVLMETVYKNTGKPLHCTKQILLGEYFKFFLSNKANQLSMDWKKL